MLNFLRLQFEGTQHRALEDVKNIVRIAQETQHRTGCRFV
jgi:inhibitor of KinA sporulation pathway (predicted exonuclease)